MQKFYIMLYYDRSDVSKVVDVNKTSASKECIICHYECFLDKGFKFQPDVCNGCHDKLMMSLILNDIAILNICGVDYQCMELAKLNPRLYLKNTNLNKKSGYHKT